MVVLHGSAPLCGRSPFQLRCRPQPPVVSRSCGVSASTKPIEQRAWPSSSGHGQRSRSCGVSASTSSSGSAPSRSFGESAPEGLVGNVSETDAQHRKRHPSFRPDCPRCQYLRYRPSWEKHYGSYRSEAQGTRSATIWLAARPARLGGTWGLGCAFCAQWAQQQADRKSAARVAGVAVPKRGRGARDGQTKWARFEIRAATQVAMRGVSQHAQTLMHRRATRAYFLPELAWQIPASRQ